MKNYEKTLEKKQTHNPQTFVSQISVSCARLFLFCIMSVVSRAAKRSRTMAPGQMMGQLNPMLTGLNPLMASMFGQGFNPMAQAMGSMMNSMPQTMGPMMDANMVARDESDDDDAAQHDQALDSASPQAVAPTTTRTPSSSVSQPAGPGGPPGNPDDAREDVHEPMPADAHISRSITYIRHLPRNRLSEVVEFCCGALDATMTAQLSQNGMLALLWIYTRIVPQVKISDLRILVKKNGGNS